jgi:hypothetical protein
MKKIYEVCKKGKYELYKTKKSLLKNYTQIGENRNTYNREELQGEPKLMNVLGPMYNGIKDGCVVIRYESEEVYDLFSN